MIEQAVKAIEEHQLIYIEEIIAFVPWTKKTLYQKKLHESNAIKKAINESKIKTKSHLRKNWRQSENPTLQIALYKLIGTEEETEKLNGARQKHEHTGQIATQNKIQIEFVPTNIPVATAEVLMPEDEEKVKQLEQNK